jgi:hypothetical protein
MLIFRNGSTKHLKFNAIGWEFPNAISPDDKSWLIIKIEVDDGVKRWKAIDPCLRIDELDSLLFWLKKIFDKQIFDDVLYFTEDAISFQISKDVLSISLDYGLHYNYDNYTKNDKKYIISFNFNELNYKDLSLGIKKMQNKLRSNI